MPSYFNSIDSLAYYNNIFAGWVYTECPTCMMSIYDLPSHL